MTKNFGFEQKISEPEKILKFLRELLAMKDPPRDARDLEKLKNAFARREKIRTIQNRDLIVVAREKNLKIPPSLQKLIQKRTVRTISGVSPIGILTKPHPCPGNCVYCPTETRMPKSYLKSQPAAARAFRHKFHPFEQVRSRIRALEESGHPTSKLEVIVMGGTWSFLPKKYQNWFVREIFRAANEEKTFPFKKTLQNLQKINETARRRVIGLTLETRPDWIAEPELARMRNFGCTRIEIGVQTLDDAVQKLTKRGHFKKDVARAMKLMKNYGFKVCFHLMPGLPGSNPEKDLKWMREIFENPDFRPDFIKIYPCQVLPHSELAKIWRAGKFQPYDDATIVKLLVQFQAFVPEYCRIMRLLRDIPVKNVISGAKFSNLRQIIENQPKKLREIVGDEFFDAHDLGNVSNFFRDIRAREIGFSKLSTPRLEKPLENQIVDFATAKNTQNSTPGLKKTTDLPIPLEPELVRRDYPASDGIETFLSFESHDRRHLFALLRLRRPSIDFEPEFFRSALKNSALVREVHSYGEEISVGEGVGAGQHRGFGRKLLAEAEKIAREEWNLKKIAVIAGVGAREYYRKFGYKLQSGYMVKKLDFSAKK